MAIIGTTTDPTGAYLEYGSGGTPFPRPNPDVEFIPGGKTSLVDLDKVRGVYAGHPAMLPKYHPGNNTASVTRQARLFILVEDVAAYREYVDTVAKRNPRAKKIMETLTVAAPVTGNAAGYGYVDFLLQNASFSDNEFYQIHEVMSDTHVTYFFGRQAPTLQISALVANTQEDDWFDAFKILYDVAIRGSRLAQDNRLLGIRIDTRVYYGTVLSMQDSISADNETLLPVSFNFSVKRIVTLNTVRQHQVPTDLRALGGDPPLADAILTPGDVEGLTQIATRQIYNYSKVGRAIITEEPTIVQQALESEAGRRFAYVARKQVGAIQGLGNAVLNAVTGKATNVDGDKAAASNTPSSTPPQTTTAAQSQRSSVLGSIFGNSTSSQGTGRTINAITSPDY